MFRLVQRKALAYSTDIDVLVRSCLFGEEMRLAPAVILEWQLDGRNGDSRAVQIVGRYNSVANVIIYRVRSVLLTRLFLAHIVHDPNLHS